jgi:hypothetical protein
MKQYYIKHPDKKEKQVAKIREFFSHPENRERQSQILKESHSRPEVKEKMSNSQKKRYANPEEVERNRETQKRIAQLPWRKAQYEEFSKQRKGKYTGKDNPTYVKLEPGVIDAMVEDFFSGLFLPALVMKYPPYGEKLIKSRIISAIGVERYRSELATHSAAAVKQAKFDKLLESLCIPEKFVKEGNLTQLEREFGFNRTSIRNFLIRKFGKEFVQQRWAEQKKETTMAINQRKRMEKTDGNK